MKKLFSQETQTERNTMPINNEEGINCDVFI